MLQTLNILQVNTLLQEQNAWHFADIFKYIFLKKKILKNKSNDRDSIFLVVFPTAKPKELLREEKSQIRKDGIIQTSPMVAINRLMDPPTWLKVAITLEKPPTPTHTNSKRLAI